MSSTRGTLITFYSWKGGVGRTMALANIAVQLAGLGRSVLIVDWDLEGPGLGRYFAHTDIPGLALKTAQDESGLLGLLQASSDRPPEREIWINRLQHIIVPTAEASFRQLNPPTPGLLHLLPSGFVQADYTAHLAEFSWNAFFAEQHGGAWLEALREDWAKSYDFVLIDSRSGLTDSGGVCAVQMPDWLVLVFTANEQSLSDGLNTIAAAQRARRHFAYDRAPLTVIPLLSRWVSDDEVDLAESWLQLLNTELSPLLETWLPLGFNARQFLERTRVPYDPCFSLGAPLPVLTHGLNDQNLPGLSYVTFSRLLNSHLEDAGAIIDPAYQTLRHSYLQSDTSPIYKPYEYLPGIIHQALNDGIARICSYQSCPMLYLLPKENSFYISGHIEQLTPLALAARDDITTSEVDDQRILETVSYVKFSSRLSRYIVDNVIQDINIQKYERYSINELIWFSILVSSRGRLLENASLTEAVFLKEVPEYLHFEYYAKEYKPLAYCMRANNTLSLNEVCTQTKKSITKVIGFYNACATLNLIEHGDRARQLIKKSTQSRKALEQVLNQVTKTPKERIKIVVAGSVGSGKTTAISSLSDFPPISSETRSSDTVTRKKATTTVAMDYGEMRLQNDLRIFLYGTPGQKRFDFFGQILCQNAWGMLLLIDNTDDDPIGELVYYLTLYEMHIYPINLKIPC